MLWIVETFSIEAKLPPLKGVNVLATNDNWALVEAGRKEIEQACEEYDVEVDYATAGKYIDLNGKSVYVDKNKNIVKSPLAVLESLGFEIDDDDKNDDSCDDALADMRRIWQL